MYQPTNKITLFEILKGFISGIRLFRTNLYTFIILVMIFLISATSCNPEEWQVVDCAECYIDRPAEAEINIKVTINNLNPSVPLSIYSGRIEEEILVHADTIRNSEWSIILPADRYYTIAATYRSHVHEIGNVTAIDGNFVRTEKVRTACDEPCWVLRGNNFNVRLKY